MSFSPLPEARRCKPSAAMNPLKRLGLLLCLAASLSVQAANNALEPLLEQGRYAVFLEQAESAAAQGDAQAQFLLGKAYHLGLGVPVDTFRAGELYEAARAQGSARASHNLGVLALDSRQQEAAIPLFLEALSRGLEDPTWSNLGRAYEPRDAGDIYDIAQSVLRLRRSGDAYARAWTLQPERVGLRSAAARQYFRAYELMSQYANDRNRLQLQTLVENEAPPHPIPLTLDALLPPALRTEALTWLRKGMENNEGEAWTNYGVLLLTGKDVDKDYGAARAAFEQGADLGVGVAYFHLGRMANAGWGQQSDPDQAIRFYRQALALGVKEAEAPLVRLEECMAVNCLSGLPVASPAAPTTEDRKTTGGPE